MAVKAAASAVRSGAISQAIEYLEIADSSATQEDHVKEMLAVLDDAGSSLRTLHDTNSGQLDFLSWDAGDEELLDLKSRLLRSLEGMTNDGLARSVTL